jgi:hypothetical protein
VPADNVGFLLEQAHEAVDRQLTEIAVDSVADEAELDGMGEASLDLGQHAFMSIRVFHPHLRRWRPQISLFILGVDVCHIFGAKVLGVRHSDFWSIAFCGTENSTFALLPKVHLREVIEGAADVIFLAVPARRFVGLLLEAAALVLLTTDGAYGVGTVFAVNDLVDDDAVASVAIGWKGVTNVFVDSAVVAYSLVRFFLERANFLAIFQALLAAAFFRRRNDELAADAFQWLFRALLAGVRAAMYQRAIPSN